jgi:hypothetical protein
MSRCSSSAGRKSDSGWRPSVNPAEL